MTQFRCYSQREDMGRCEEQCEFCYEKYVPKEKRIQRSYYKLTDFKKGTTPLGSRLPAEVVFEIEKVIKKHNMSRSRFVLTAIVEKLNKKKFKKKLK